MCVLSVYARYIFACFFLTTVHINFVIANITVVIFNALSPCRHVAMLPLLTSNKISKKRKKNRKSLAITHYCCTACHFCAADLFIDIRRVASGERNAKSRATEMCIYQSMATLAVGQTEAGAPLVRY